MEKRTDFYDFIDKIQRQDRYIEHIEEENRKLKEEYDNFKKKVSDDMKEITKNQLENIDLFDKLEQEYKKLKEENELLKECNIRNYTSRSNTDDWNLKLLEENKKLKSYLNLVIDERDNAFKKIEQLREKIEELELDYDRLKIAFEDVVSGE